MQLPAAFHYFLPLMTKYYPNSLFSNTFNTHISNNHKRSLVTHTKQQEKLKFCTLIFTLLSDQIEGKIIKKMNSTKNSQNLI
jgi:hypothetical protein